jgi:uncharacterized radical SAM superfamily Fe-S cluster-containing enzyme
MLQPRPYLIEEYTRAVCPRCMAAGRRSDDPGVFLDGMLVSHDGSVWMRRICPVHGDTESLYEEDLQIWGSRQGWSTPTLRIHADRPDNFKGFPDGYRDGLPSSHGQHTCILLLNITEHCNYRCPTCYASALEPGVPADEPLRPTIDEICQTVDVMLEREEGKLGVVMLSGGEPTVRRDLEKILTALFEKNITRVMINTNGRRIARDNTFLEFLRANRRRIEVYLQFDGLNPETYEHFRGEDVAEEKRLALQRLNDAGVFTTLVVTAKRGVNEHELGSIIRLGLDTPYCAGAAIQPVFGSGRNSGIDPMDRLTPTGVLKGLGEQTAGLVRAEDFVPLPCSHRDCCDITYFLKSGSGEWRSLPSMIGRDELKKWIHLASNTISFDSASGAVKEMIRSGAIQRVLSEQQKTSALAMAKDILSMCHCIPGLPEIVGGIWTRVQQSDSAADRLAQSTFRITVKMFMDAHTFHEARIRQCCVHTGTFEDDPRRYSFCWRWLFSDANDFPNHVRPKTLKVIA